VVVMMMMVVVVAHHPVMHLVAMRHAVVRHVMVHCTVMHSMMPRVRRGRAGGERKDEGGGERCGDDFQSFSPTFGWPPNRTGGEA
jgi:hypothetical protein